MQLRPWQRHSQVLAVAGSVYALYGLIVLGVSPMTPGREASLRLALYLPRGVLVAVWVGVGMLALTSTRWPPQSKTWGYTALSTLACAWGFVHLISILIGAPASNVGGAMVWWLVAYLWWAIAGLTNPDDKPKEP